MDYFYDTVLLLLFLLLYLKEVSEDSLNLFKSVKKQHAGLE